MSRPVGKGTSGDRPGESEDHSMSEKLNERCAQFDGRLCTYVDVTQVDRRAQMDVLIVSVNVFCAGGASCCDKGIEASSSEDRILHQPIYCECSWIYERLGNK